jgi:hypothetical protein
MRHHLALNAKELLKFFCQPATKLTIQINTLRIKQTVKCTAKPRHFLILKLSESK